MQLSISNVGHSLEKFSPKCSEDVPLIRKADLENHNKDGGLWIVIHNKVYDVQDFKTQTQCGKDVLLDYSGNFFLFYYYHYYFLFLIKFTF